jgi:hypothetical protein
MSLMMGQPPPQFMAPTAAHQMLHQQQQQQQPYYVVLPQNAQPGLPQPMAMQMVPQYSQPLMIMQPQQQPQQQQQPTFAPQAISILPPTGAVGQAPPSTQQQVQNPFFQGLPS